MLIVLCLCVCRDMCVYSRRYMSGDMYVEGRGPPWIVSLIVFSFYFWKQGFSLPWNSKVDMYARMASHQAQ